VKEFCSRLRLLEVMMTRLLTEKGEFGKARVTAIWGLACRVLSDYKVFMGMLSSHNLGDE
jgi:hypothetical protein